jgi:hypothetical protein
MNHLMVLVSTLFHVTLLIRILRKEVRVQLRKRNLIDPNSTTLLMTCKILSKAKGFLKLHDRVRISHAMATNASSALGESDSIADCRVVLIQLRIE